MVASKVRTPRIDEVTGDKIFPLRFMDSSEVFTKIALDFTLRFDDVLDPEKLRLSLERLVQIGNWHQIGARYRKNVSHVSLVIFNRIVIWDCLLMTDSGQGKT